MIRTAIILLLAMSLAAADPVPPVPLPIRTDHRGLLTIDGVLRADSQGAWGAGNLVVRPPGGYAAQDYSLSDIVREGQRLTAHFATTPRLRLAQTVAEAKDGDGTLWTTVTSTLTPVHGGRASFDAVYAVLPLASADLAGATVILADGRRMLLPAEPAGEVVVHDARQLELLWGDRRLRVRSDELRISLHDLRPKTTAFHIRLAHASPRDADALHLAYAVSAEAKPYVVQADDATWVELPPAGDPHPGGILDFSALAGDPAGSEGRIVVRDGHLALSGSGRRIRLIGANLCYTANYPDREAADRLAARFRAMGYNAVRFHHTDIHMRTGAWDGQSSHDVDAANLDRLDYLFAAMKRAGLYITIDLYTQRRFGRGEIPGIDRVVEGDIKALVPIHEPAFMAWSKLVEKWLRHVNPYTGIAWKDDPALFSICPLNEDSIASVWAGGPAKALYLERFAAWRRERGVASSDAPPAEDPQFARFLVEVKTASNRRIEAYLRDLGVQALITGSNWWNTMPQAFTRDGFDLVDNHQYADHPVPHWLPARYNQKGNLGGNPTYMTPIFMASTRIFGKPFCVSEWNYCAPNRFRAEGGALMGAYAALQDWDALFRFAWAHDEKLLDGTAPVRGFDIATDPLSQLSERQVALLFRRGDVAPASKRFVYGVTLDDATRQGIGDMWSRGLFPHAFNALALVSQTGSQVIEGGRPVVGAFDGVVAPQRPSDAVLAGNPYLSLEHLPPVAEQMASDTGEIIIDRARGALRVVTPASACVVTADASAWEAGGLAVSGSDGFAAVSAHAMDGQPLLQSRRMLLLHLTDVANQGMRFTGPERTTLLHWGSAPHLLRTGSVEVRIRSEVPGMRLYACDHAGQRTGVVEAAYADGRYSFRAVIARATPRMVYELVTE